MKDLLKKIIEALKGILPADQIPQVETALNGLQLEDPTPPAAAPVVDPSKITDPAMKQIVESLQSQMNLVAQQNKTLIETLTRERTDREKAMKTQEDQLKTEHETKIKAAVEGAIKEGKFPEAQRQDLTDSATANLTAFEKMVKAIPVNKHFKPEEKPGEGKGTKETPGETKLKSPLETGNVGILSKVKEFAGVTE